MAAPDQIVCALSCAPTRNRPDHRAEMTSQFLFGETACVLDASQAFWKVRANSDGYAGWIDARQFEELQQTNVSQPPMIVDDFYGELPLGNEVHRLPMGAVIHEYLQDSFHGALRVVAPPTSVGEMLDYARRYLTTPYLWGGRSPWGIDCSGLVQMVFRAFGVALPRDSSEQIHHGQPVSDFAHAQPGDLAFFEGSGDHVGLILGEGEILHASGRVRIDDLSHIGITHRQSKKPTHRLIGLRRLLSF